MPCLRLLFATLILGTGLGGTGHAQGWPPLEGELTGKFEWRALAGTPPLAWRVKMSPPGASAPAGLSATVTAPGLKVGVEATLPGRWQVVDGTITLAEWGRPVLAAVWSGMPPDLEVGGTMQLGGEGSWAGTEIDGRLTLAMADGFMRSASQELEVQGLVLEAVVSIQPDGATLQTMRLIAEKVRAADVKAGHLLVEAVGGADGRMEVRRAEVEVFGGRITLSPFTFDPTNPEVTTTAELTGLALAELARLMPTALASATGRIEGRIGIEWSEAAGFQPKSGSLTIAPDVPATLRLAAAPGFLTQHLPERIQLLPAWLRLPANWLAPVNPAYGTLESIEMGRQDLRVEQLRVALYPDGPEGMRSATVEVTARPATGSAVELVSFTVNVAGSLQQVLQLGMDDRASLDFKSGK